MNLNKQIYIVCEVEHSGELSLFGEEILARAIEIAEQLSYDVIIIAFGKSVRLYDYIDKIRVILIEEEIPFYNYYPFQEIVNCIQKELLACIIFEENPFWKNIAAMCACYFDGGLIADCSEIFADSIRKKIIFKRLSFSGDMEALITTPKEICAICTVREGIFSNWLNKNGQKILIQEQYRIEKKQRKFEQLIQVCDTRLHKETNISLKGKHIIFGIGRGVRFEDIELIKEIAVKLDAGVGYSKPLIDKGVDTRTSQIGYSGNNIKCDLYIAIGISGNIYHAWAIKQCKKICAVNIDSDAMIFNYAHINIISDSHQFIKVLYKMVCKEKMCIKGENE